MKIKTLLLAGALCAFSVWAKPANAQWNAYDSMMSNNSFSRGWVNPYNNTFTNAYKWMTPSYNAYSYSSSGYFRGGSRRTRAARRAASLRKLPPRQRTEIQRFAKYNGQMYKPSKSVNTPAKLAAIFAKNTGGKVSDFQPVMREL